jgi:hypothetical protein
MHACSFAFQDCWELLSSLLHPPYPCIPVPCVLSADKLLQRSKERAATGAPSVSQV